MNLHAKLAASLIVIGALAIIGYKYALPLIQAEQQKESSDARDLKGKLTIGMDNWVGYFPLCSSEMKKQMRRHGYALACEDDKADYGARMQRLKTGEIQFAVATVDSYLLNGAAKAYPGTIVVVIDESRGGDALVAWKEQVGRIEDLKKASGITIAFTPGSPSEHLLKSLATHFDVSTLRQKTGGWRVEATGSPDALEKLQSRKVSAAVLWEPDVSRALAIPGVVKLLGTEDTKKLIVDVLLVNREFAKKNPEVMAAVIGTYFRVLGGYTDNREQLQQDVKQSTGQSIEQVSSMLNGVAWAGLADNAEYWFGAQPGTADGVVDAVESALHILLDAGDFKENPIPEKDPYRLINRQYVLDAHQKAGPGARKTVAASALERPFTPLDAKAWAALREVGTLKTRPVSFQSGTSDLSFEGKQELDKMAENLKHYPNFRVVVKGHTGMSGDPQENKKLARERAESVARYLIVTFGLDINRLNVLGFGSDQPLARQPGESDRAYGYRLPRVELSLVTEGAR